MNLPVILRRIAQAEFDDAADWYEGQRAGRGAAFTAAVRRVLVAIGARPEAHPEVYGDVREPLVARYPYAIYYQRADRELRTGEISAFEFGQQRTSLLFRAGLSHNLAAMDRLHLMSGRLGFAVRSQIFDLKRLGVSQVGVQRQ